MATNTLEKETETLESRLIGLPRTLWVWLNSVDFPDSVASGSEQQSFEYLIFYQDRIILFDAFETWPDPVSLALGSDYSHTWNIPLSVANEQPGLCPRDSCLDWYLLLCTLWINYVKSGYVLAHSWLVLMELERKRDSVRSQNLN